MVRQPPGRPWRSAARARGRDTRKPSEYIRGPQHFQSIQLYEGEQSLRHAIEAHTLMFATDYPHSRELVPEVGGVGAGVALDLRAGAAEAAVENAARCYGRLAAITLAQPVDIGSRLEVGPAPR